MPRRKLPLFLPRKPCCAETLLRMRKRKPKPKPRPPKTTIRDLGADILCRLPVKTLGQLKCVSKEFRSLISNPEFAQMQLQSAATSSNRRHVLSTHSRSFLDSRHYWDTTLTLSSVFGGLTLTVPATPLISPAVLGGSLIVTVGSCDGIVCFDIGLGLALLWNPSIRKYLPLSIFEFMYGVVSDDQNVECGLSWLSFGYDTLARAYKVVGVFVLDRANSGNENDVPTLVVYDVGTDSQESMMEFPHGRPTGSCGKFLNDTANWLATADSESFYIVSFNLGSRSYQMLSLPDHGGDLVQDGLVVLRDCLSILITNDSHATYDVWIMNDYGIEESWNKLFAFPYQDMLQDARMIHMYEDDVLIKLGSNVVIYNYKIGDFKTPVIENMNGWGTTTYVESLIWPWPSYKSLD